MEFAKRLVAGWEHLYRSIAELAALRFSNPPATEAIPWKKRETLGLEGGACRYLREIEEGRLIYGGSALGPPSFSFYARIS